MQRAVYYNGDTSKPFHLEESRDLFLIRVAKGKEPGAVLAAIPALKPYLGEIRMRAKFPGSNTYVYKCLSTTPGFRDHLKALIKKAGAQEMMYAGSVFNFSNTGIYQVYTENIFLKFHDAIPASFIRSFLERNSLQIKRPLSFGDSIYFLEAKQSHGRDIFSFCEALLNNSEVQLCHPEMVTQLKRTNRSFPLEAQLKPQLVKDWWLKRTGVPEAWNYSKGANTTIAVIDDGIEMDHVAFKGRIVHPRDMMDASGTRLPLHCSDEGHGTACASVACSADARALGVAPLASLMPIRITGLGSVLQSEAIYYAVNKGADVISCSWGPPDGDPFDPNHKVLEFPLPDHTRLAFEYAVKHGRKGKGTPIVFAAGNGKEQVKYDGYASSEHVIAVSAINHRDRPTIYSDYGPPTYCTFPSGDFEIGADKNPFNATGISAADRLGAAGSSEDDWYSLFSGTSASCPGVAGVISLMYAADPTLRLHQVKDILKRSCEKIALAEKEDQPGYNKNFGHGLLRADKAIANTLNKLNTRSIPNTMENQNKNAVSLHIGINTVDTTFYKGFVPPLKGCINDMNAMQQLAAQLGYATTVLSDAQATRQNILSTITALGNTVKEGGILLVTYAGHGAPIPNVEGDSEDEDDNLDGEDQAWVSYDGFLLDDELFAAFSKINTKIRVLLVSDSCHSESMNRVIELPGENALRIRSINSATVQAVLQANKMTVRSLKAGVAPKKNLKYKVFVKALSACTKKQKAAETRDNRGLYTKALENVYSTIQKDPAIDYRKFVDLIASEIKVLDNTNDQSPRITNSHNFSTAFDAQFPFAIAEVDLDARPGWQETPEEQVSPAPKKEPALFFETGKLYIESKARDEKKKEQLRGAWRSGQLRYERVQRSLATRSGWDEAYQYLLANSAEVDFVEPEIVSCMHFTKDSTTEGSRDTGSYLGTYPDPETYKSPVPFIWHLDEEHSQLAKAARAVFPELAHGARNAETTDLVKIGHIDTGYLEHHPALPVNIDTKNATRFNLGDDTAIDNDAILALMEQQGHGNATMAILAGNWVDVDITESSYKGFYGAIPYAKVLPIKISETVALLSGQNFAKAVDYAIEQGCDVITMSMAGLPGKVMAKAVNRAYEAGIVIVSAASNSFSKGVGIVLPKRTLYPARYDRVIAATGATCNKKPYLNEYHTDNTRAEGGLYMQTCYGPESVLPTTIGAYTPNVSWFHKMGSAKDPSYYVKSGGGTSSATPQVAAAAALYIQKYKGFFKKFTGKDAWKKAEIVRQALFNSCDASTDYNFVYGRGLLRGFDALDPKYEPSQYENTVTKAEAAPEKRRLLGGLVGVFFNRSLAAESNKALQDKLQDMMATEISQLMHKDPELFPYLDSVKLDKEELSLDSPGLVEKIVQSKYASDFLKQQLSIQHTHNETGIRAGNAEFNNRYIAGIRGAIRISARGVTFHVNNKKSYKEFHRGVSVWVDEFDLELGASRDLGQGAEREFQIDVGDDSLQSVMLMEKVYEDGTIVEWKSDVLDAYDNKVERSVNATASARNVYTFSTRELQAGDRGLFDGVKKVAVKVYKWVAGKVNAGGKEELKKLVAPLGDNTYEILVFDLDSPDNTVNPVWRNIDTMDASKIYKAIEDEKNKQLLVMLPGLFSTVEKGFDEFLESAENREELRKRHCQYILGWNMPTVVHGVEENAKQLHTLLKSKFSKPKSCNVLARSRGGVVARYLFEKTWTGSTNQHPLKLNKLIMFGTPNQGTMIASSKNWKSLFNYATNIARVTLGTVAPVVPTVLTAIKALGLGFVNLPGIDDMEEESKVITLLNGTKLNRDNYFVFTSDFEPNHKLLKRLFDQLAVDTLIFKGEQNDSIAPVPGAVFKNPDIQGNVVQLAANQYSISDGSKQVSHFTYLHPQHPEIITQLFTLI